MGEIVINAGMENRPPRAFLPTAGKYGQGLDYDADVELIAFEYDTQDNRPAYARTDLSRHFAYFNLKVVHDGKAVFIRHHEPIDADSGSQLREILQRIGVQLEEKGVDEDGKPQWGFREEDVAPRKLTGVEVGDPITLKSGQQINNLVGLKMIG